MILPTIFKTKSFYSKEIRVEQSATKQIMLKSLSNKQFRQPTSFTSLFKFWTCPRTFLSWDLRKLIYLLKITQDNIRILSEVSFFVTSMSVSLKRDVSTGWIDTFNAFNKFETSFYSNTKIRKKKTKKSSKLNRLELNLK